MSHLSRSSVPVSLVGAWRWSVVALAVACSIVVDLVARAAGTANTWLGVHAVLAFSCVLAAGLMAGRIAGAVTGAAAALGFVVIIAYADPPSPVGKGVPVMVLWTLIGYLTGSGADWLRARVEAAHGWVETERDEQQRIAAALQSALYPAQLPSLADLSVEVYFRPAGNGNELGGDVYDVWVIPDTDVVGFLVCDVSGKGAQAASIAALCRHTARTASVIGLAPVEALDALNGALLRRTDTSRFATAVLGVATPKRQGLEIRFACAGHPLPILHRGNSRDTYQVGVPGTLLGVFPHPALTTTEVNLDPLDSLIVYTDGATDVRDTQGVLGEDGLINSIKTSQRDHLLTAIRAAILEKAALPQDDIAVLILQPAARNDDASRASSEASTSPSPSEATDI